MPSSETELTLPDGTTLLVTGHWNTNALILMLMLSLLVWVALSIVQHLRQAQKVGSPRDDRGLDEDAEH